MSARAKHQNWISPATASYDPYGGSYLRGRVGASSAEDARDVVRLIDDVSQYFVVTLPALELQKWIFDVADSLGIKDQVEYVVYGLRAGSSTGIAGAAGGYALSTSLAGVGALAAALPVAAAVVAVVAFFAGSGDDAAEEKQKKLRKKAQDKIQHLRERLTLANFASEQRAAAAGAVLTPALQKDAETAKRIADLYDRAQKELPPAQQAMFESISNLARWRGILESYSKMHWKERDDFDSIGFGTSQPRLPWQLKGPIQAETAKLQKLVAAAEVDRPGAKVGGGTLALLIAAAAAGVYAAYNPAGAASLARSAGSKVIGAGRAGIAKFRRVTP